MRYYLYFSNPFDDLEDMRKSGGQVGSTVKEEAISTMVKGIVLEPYWLGLKPNFIPPSSVTLGKLTFLCPIISICKITVPYWVAVRTNEITYIKLTCQIPHPYVRTSRFPLLSQIFPTCTDDCKADKLVGNTVPGRLIGHYLFSEALKWSRTESVFPTLFSNNIVTCASWTLRVLSKC